MRTTVNINDDVLNRANDLFSSMKPSELLNQAIKEMVARESARRLADLYGSAPDASVPGRRDSVMMEDTVKYNPKKTG